MFDPILFTALLTTVLFGGVLFRTLRSERRRMNLESRLSTIAKTASGSDGPVVSLRRSRSPRKALPMALSARLDIALAATGNRIRPGHLAAAGIMSAVAIGLVCVAAALRPALAIILVGAGKK